MARPTLSVTRAGLPDVADVAGLWVASAVATGTTADMAARAASSTRVAEALARAGTAVFVARLEDRACGLVVVTSRTHGLLDPVSLSVDELFVTPDSRRQGVAAQLMNAVARHAESEGLALIVAAVPASDKASNRFFARLGFGGSVTHRTVTTAGLRRKLSTTDARSRDILLGRRRAIRARIGTGAERDTGPIPTRPLAIRRGATG